MFLNFVLATLYFAGAPYYFHLCCPQTSVRMWKAGICFIILHHSTATLNMCKLHKSLMQKLKIIEGESYLAEQFRQITHHLAEQFCQITNYLAEQFRQIAHYSAEHQIQKNDILFSEFLTLWMQECKYSGMHTSKYASMQVCKYSNKQLCNYASV